MSRIGVSAVHPARIAVLVSFGLALIACGGDKPTGPSQHPKVTVLVARSPGVARDAPGSDSLVVDSGTAVTYSFSSASGYTNLLVTLNDQEVSPSGSFAPVRESRLLAVADSIVTLQTSDSGLLTASAALARAADPYQAYQAYQALSESLRTAVGAPAAAYRLSVAIAETLDPVRDAPALARLAGIVAESMSVQAVAPRIPRSPPASADAPYRVVFLYVNGIGGLWGKDPSFEEVRDGPIMEMVAAAGFSDPALYAVGGFYNPSAKFFSLESLTAWTCYGLKANFFGLGLFSRWLKTPACNAGGAWDLAESMLQVTNAILGRAPDSQQPDVLAFADSIGRVLSRGSRVVLIAHSQGNLYAQQALIHLSSGPFAARLGCVGTVGIAPPTSEGWPVEPSSLEQLMAVGTLSSDILYQLRLPHTLDVHLRTAKTAIYDRWLQNLQTLGFSGFPAAAVLKKYLGIEIHYFESYYDDVAGGAAIVADIRDQVSQTEQNCPPTPTHVSGRVIDGATGAGLGSVTLRLLTSGSETARVTTSQDGAYQVSVPAGVYDVVADANGYVSVTLFGAQVAGQSTVLETIPLVPTSPVPGAISGSVRDARTGFGISGAVVELRAGMHALTGSPEASTLSDAAGDYRFDNLPSNTYTVSATASGYVSGVRTGIVVGGTEVAGQNVALSPTGGGGELRIVLTWGAAPSDLDSHLTGPTETGDRFHVFWLYRGSLTSSPWAALDLDDRDGVGPETITIGQQLTGVYRYSVHDFSNAGSMPSTALATSGARVDLYRGDALVGTFFPPNVDGTLWTVFELDGSTLRSINQMSYETTSGAVPAPPRASVQADAAIIGAAVVHAKP